jgi:hypothetical protein
MRIYTGARTECSEVWRFGGLVIESLRCMMVKTDDVEMKRA